MHSFGSGDGRFSLGVVVTVHTPMPDNSLGHSLVGDPKRLCDGQAAHAKLLQLNGAGVEDERSVTAADTCGLTIVSRLSYNAIRAFPLDQRRG